MIIFNTSSVVECTTLALSPAVEVSHAVPLPFAASYAGGSDALHAVTERYTGPLDFWMPTASMFLAGVGL